MTTFLNKKRPPCFCPGCTHERIVSSLNKAFSFLSFDKSKIVIVSDIGCSGLFDTFFDTNAFHGLHGRVLTYATGIKLSKPDLNVVATIGDGGLGIGGAHFLAACRRNLNITLIILNNYNFGMTGGQFSSTTPTHAEVNSGFLNKLEIPIDPCQVAKSAGAPYISRCSGYDRNLYKIMASAISYDGMSVLDIHGICTGRYTRRNRISPKIISKNLSKLPVIDGEIKKNIRNEYIQKYKIGINNIKKDLQFKTINQKFKSIKKEKNEILILGKAGQRIITAGEILCLGAIFSGKMVNQKSDYPITVLRGHSISEIILSSEEINYIGLKKPDIIIAIAQEGVDTRKWLFDTLNINSIIITGNNVKLPQNKAKIYVLDFRSNGISSQNMALASLAFLAKKRKIINTKILTQAMKKKFNSKVYKNAYKLVKKINRNF